MSHTTFYVRWHHVLKSVMLIRGGGGGPSLKVRGFCKQQVAGHVAKFADRLLAILNKPQPHHTPKKQRTIIRDAHIQTTTNPMQDRNFGMFRGQRSTLGNGLSGEPRTQILTALQRGWDRPLGKCTLPQSSVSWYSNLWPSKSQNLQFDQWDESSVSVCSGQIFWTFEGLPSQKVAPIKSQCRAAYFAQWNARLG